MFSTKNVVRILGLILLLALIVPTVSSITQTNAEVSDNIIISETSVTPVTENTVAKSTGDGPVKDVKDNNAFIDETMKMERINNQDLIQINDDFRFDSAKSTVRDLPDPISTLVNATPVTGAVTQNEFNIYEFDVTAVNGSTATIIANWTTTTGDFLDTMVDDAAGNTLGGSYGGTKTITTTVVVLIAGSYSVVLHGADVTTSLTYTLELVITDPPEDTGPDGLTYETMKPIDCVNGSYAGVLAEADITYPYISNYGYTERDVSFYSWYWSEYQGTYWYNFTIPAGYKFDVNVTLEFDSGDCWLMTGTDFAVYYPSAYTNATDGGNFTSIFQGGMTDGFQILVVCWDPAATYPINFTLGIIATETEPYPIDQAFDIIVGDEVMYDNDTLLPYNITLTANTTYLVEIGEPDSNYPDLYAGQEWNNAGYDNNVVLYVDDYNGTNVNGWSDSMGEYGLWNTPWFSRFTAPYTGEYTVWFGPIDEVSASVGTFQIIDAAWAVDNAPQLSSATGDWFYNSTTGDVNAIDIYTIEVNASVAGWLHVVTVTDDFGDDVHYGNLLYDENLTLVKDSGFRTAVIYGEPYADPTIGEMLPEGNYTYVIQTWFPLAGDTNQSYTITHEMYNVASLDPEQTMTDQVVPADGIAYYVLDPSISSRYNFWGIDVFPNATSDITATLYDADLQHVREIRNDGGEGVTESIVHCIDSADSHRDSGAKKVIVVTSNSTHDATFNITFGVATGVADLLVDGVQTGVLDPINNPTNFHRIVAVAGDYKFNYTTEWYNTTDGTSLPWDDSPEQGNNTWIRVWKLDGSAVAVSYANINYLDVLTLQDGVYFIWVTTGDWNVDASNLYGRCGWATNLDVSYTLELVEFEAPVATALAVYADGSAAGIDVAFDVTLESGVTYYFWWDDSPYDYDATLSDFVGNIKVSGSAGWDPFIYTPLFGGVYNLWLHEYEWNSTGSADVTVRPLELLETHAPDHIVSQWSYDFTLEHDYWYIIELIGNSYTSMSGGEGIIVDEITDPYTADLDFFAKVSGSAYAASFAGMFTMNIYKVPHLIETIIETTTETETTTAAEVTVTDTTTVTGANVTVTGPGVAVTETTTKTESPGFELLVFLLAIPALFVIRRRRR